MPCGSTLACLRDTSSEADGSSTHIFPYTPPRPFECVFGPPRVACYPVTLRMPLLCPAVVARLQHSLMFSPCFLSLFRTAVKDAARAGVPRDAAATAHASLVRLAAAMRADPHAASLLLARHGIPGQAPQSAPNA